MATILKAKATLKGRDKTALFLKLREAAGIRPVIYAQFMNGKRMENMEGEELQP